MWNALAVSVVMSATYHKPQQQKKPYGCRYPDCTNNSVYFALGNNAEYRHICKEHYMYLQDMFKKYYTLPVDLT